MRSDGNTALAIILSCVPIAGWGINVAYQTISFDRNCGGYLIRAANSNTVPLAQQELKKALHYLQAEGMTHGYTSVLYTTPDEDVGFWHENLVQSYEELKTLSEKPDLTALEQSNTLLKLRDTLTDHSGGHESLTRPAGIAMYPKNTSNAVLGWLAILFAAIGSLFAVATKDN